MLDLNPNSRLTPPPDLRRVLVVSDPAEGFSSNKQMTNLKAEAQEPFRFFKLYAFGSLAAGASLGLIIILTRLAAAIKVGRRRLTL